MVALSLFLSRYAQPAISATMLPNAPVVGQWHCRSHVALPSAGKCTVLGAPACLSLEHPLPSSLCLNFAYLKRNSSEKRLCSSVRIVATKACVMVLSKSETLLHLQMFPVLLTMWSSLCFRSQAHNVIDVGLPNKIAAKKSQSIAKLVKGEGIQSLQPSTFRSAF